MTDREDLRCVIGLVCVLKGWNRKQFARAAGLHRVTVSRLEHGDRGLSSRTEEALRRAAGLLPSTWRELLAVVGRARREMTRSPGERVGGPNAADPLSGLLDRTSARLTEAFEILLAPADPGANRDRDNAASAWERLRRQPKETRRALIEEAPEFQTLALAERLGAESNAAEDPERSLEWASLSRRAGELAGLAQPSLGGRR